MFERFTDRARRVVVLANEEDASVEPQLHRHGASAVRTWCTNAIDLAAQVLESFSVTLSAARHEVVEINGRPGSSVVEGHIPFTPEALTVLGAGSRRGPPVGPQLHRH